MKILMIVAEDFCIEDVRDAFCLYGNIVELYRSDRDTMLDGDSNVYRNLIKDSKFDLVFTFNYYPSIAILCKEMSIRYISWVYDNPYVHLYSYTVIFPTNTIYVFERDIADYFFSQGINTIQYLPLAANPSRLAKVISYNQSLNKVYTESKNVSFVGSMYTEQHQFYSRMINNGISPFTMGYLQGIINAQKKLYGCDIITPLLTKEIIADMKKALPLEPDKGSAATTEYLFAKYVIDRQITAEERTDMLSLAGKEFDVHVFTTDTNINIPNCINHGPAHSDFEAPLIYNSSKINLNISLRSIINGIPLRIFEIMGSGGFVLTNYQAELFDYFIPGEDFDYFDSPEDMINKIAYYLNHEEVRIQIANNGLNKVKKYHSFDNRIKEMKL